MWWLALPVLGIGKLIYDAVTESPAHPPRRRSILEQNLQRLSFELTQSNRLKVGILGQPGAGKSLLLKKMTKSRVRPLPLIGAETDATNWAEDISINLLSTYKDVVFVDVPGYDTATHPASTVCQNFPFDDFDVFIFVVRGKLRGADEAVFAAIAASDKPVCIARSFAESCNEVERDAVTADLLGRLHLSSDHHIGFFSNRSGEGITDIFDAVTGCERHEEHLRRSCRS